MEMIRNKLWLKIPVIAALALAAIIVVNAFWPAETRIQKERKDYLEAQPNAQQTRPEKLYQTALLHKPGRSPANLNVNEVVSFADTETLTWIMENVEYQAGRGTRHEVEIFPVAYDKTLLENINGTHVLFSNGDVKFLRRREVEIIDSY